MSNARGMPGGGGGGLLKLRFDLYIMLNKDKFHNRQDLKQADVNQNIL